MQVFGKTSGRSYAMATLATGLVLSMYAAPVLAQDRGSSQRESNAFTWSGNVDAGRRIMIKNINGPIRVERSSSGRVEVNADKEWRRGDPANVRIEQQRTSTDDILVCAMWNPESRCDEDGINTPRGNRNNINRDNDVKVSFVVRVPDGVRVDVNTVNGELYVGGATAEVDASTVNGNIEARSAGGPVRASTVNGDIHVAMGSLGNSSDLEYQTVNGDVTVEVPSNFGARLDLSTVNGRVNTDFPITVSGSLSPRRMRGTVGNGATRMSASTVNGSITLRRGN